MLNQLSEFHMTAAGVHETRSDLIVGLKTWQGKGWRDFVLREFCRRDKVDD